MARLDQKGTIMAEAALVMPLIILAVMAVIYAMIFLEKQVDVRSEMHMQLWAERGAVSHTMQVNHHIDGHFPVYSRKVLSGGTVYYEGNLPFAGRGLLKNFGSMSRGSLSWLRERDVVRAADLAGGGDDE